MGNAVEAVGNTVGGAVVAAATLGKDTKTLKYGLKKVEHTGKEVIKTVDGVANTVGGAVAVAATLGQDKGAKRMLSYGLNTCADMVARATADARATATVGISTPVAPVVVSTDCSINILEGVAKLIDVLVPPLRQMMETIARHEIRRGLHRVFSKGFGAQLRQRGIEEVVKKVKVPSAKAQRLVRELMEELWVPEALQAAFDSPNDLRVWFPASHLQPIVSRRLAPVLALGVELKHWTFTVPVRLVHRDVPAAVSLTLATTGSQVQLRLSGMAGVLSAVAGSIAHDVRQQRLPKSVQLKRFDLTLRGEGPHVQAHATCRASVGAPKIKV